ncbi:MAG: bifunctional phosphoribosylaminoimidazolecarboxamide formyltransferase/inosine monophosphate cyclohydrolase [Gammaproteobacteria bacterium]|nr:bifunctional phosphoribosylaminoimidazolecarboxamide formyltransferase/inosine monophosphate cyclohydrolase [Gammaproteobacteria bacterium]
MNRALISVSDKDKLIPFAKELDQNKVEIISTGGTYNYLSTNKISAIEISNITNFPEIMDGRVKTLHPKIHGGILGRKKIDDEIMDQHDIEKINLLAVNLYPFKETIKKHDISINEAIENIDIGGPAMIRAAAKNHENVVVLVDPSDYEDFIEKYEHNQITIEYRQYLAAKAFGHTASYDAAINQYFNKEILKITYPDQLIYSGNIQSKLRYGENPHQTAAFYKDDMSSNERNLASSRKIQGKDLSYNNIADGAAAYECVNQFSSPACVIVKHANPCGVALDDSIKKAYMRAFSTDPTSAFGGIIAFNRPLDGETAKLIIEKQFVEVIIAPEISSEAETILNKKQDVRVLETGKFFDGDNDDYDLKKVSGGLLIQSADDGKISESDLKIVTQKKPSKKEISDMLFAWRVGKYVKSNAILFCKDNMTIGIGAGQMSRVYSARIAAIKAADEDLDISNSVMSSDAFFPFRDGIDAVASYGISAIIQPGGSIRDDEVIAAANENNIAMVFTGMRHFRH